MSRRFLYRGILGGIGIFAVGMGGFFFFQVKKTSESVSENQGEIRPAKVHPMEFFGEEFFWRHKKDDEERRYHFGTVRGAIIPHHLLPGEVISGTLHQLSSPDIRTVILIGPNHYERGKTPILTETASWETPFGVLEGDNSKTQELLKEVFVSEDFDVLQKEHSITGVAPYIRYYFPNARIVPVVVSQKITEEEKRRLVLLLKKQLQVADTVAVAAVDFSHFLVSDGARKKNAETLKVMRDRSYKKMLSYGNDHVDSPESIEIYLRTMDVIGAGRFDVLHDTDSGRLTRNANIAVTSYFGIINTTE